MNSKRLLFAGLGPILMLLWLIGTIGEQHPEDHLEPEYGVAGTFSIVAVDPETGISGAAVASKYPAVGKAVAFARGGVGAFCTQQKLSICSGKASFLKKCWPNWSATTPAGANASSPSSMSRDKPPIGTRLTPIAAAGGGER